MNFELGKRYIVDVTEKGIVPLMEFDRDKWFHKDHDDLDFLTEEEKALAVNYVLGEIRQEVLDLPTVLIADLKFQHKVMQIIDMHKAGEDE